MTVLRALCSVQSAASTIPRDQFVNTWHFHSTNPSATAPSAHTALTAFYQAIDVYLSAHCSTTMNIRWYDLADAEPRTPFDTDTIALTLGSGNALPNECASVLSYRADLESGANPARRRGRIFIGPLDADDGTNTSGDWRFTSTFRNAVAAAALALAQATITDSLGWVVFSPTSAGPAPWSEGALDASSWPVTAGYVDDAVDIVRSRGLAPSARSTFVVP